MRLRITWLNHFLWLKTSFFPWQFQLNPKPRNTYTFFWNWKIDPLHILTTRIRSDFVHSKNSQQYLAPLFFSMVKSSFAPTQISFNCCWLKTSQNQELSTFSSANAVVSICHIRNSNGSNHWHLPCGLARSCEMAKSGRSLHPTEWKLAYHANPTLSALLEPVDPAWLGSKIRWTCFAVASQPRKFAHQLRS